ncbi:MAG: aspartate carbamoyltransferase catalytic subunit [Erysipelothrix sp.]
MKNFLSVDDLEIETVTALITQAIKFKEGSDVPQFRGTVVNMFFENSTRTKHSFEMAEHKLGLHTMNFDVSTSSVNKGESLYDSVLTMQALGADVAVIRHGENDFYETLEPLSISIINAGSGCGSHPSQSLLDMMTIVDEFKTLVGLKVVIVGDIRHSRVAMSNMKLLKRMGAQVYFSGPKKFFDESYLAYGEYIELDEALKKVDVVMLLRIQLERHEDVMKTSQKTYHEFYGLTEKRYESLLDHAIIMHPAPVNRDVEIADCLVESKKSRIVDQMTNGVYMRMAILEKIMEDKI